MMTRAWLMVGAALLAGGATGCDKDESFITEAEVKAEIGGAVDNAVPHCTPGRALDCPCPMGAMGVQVCAADGKSYGACADCWSSTPPSGSSSSSGGAPMSQKVMCDAKTSASAFYPGLKAEDLFGVRVISHDPNASPGSASFSTVGGNFGDGYVSAGCPGDYDIFLGP